MKLRRIVAGTVAVRPRRDAAHRLRGDQHAQPARPRPSCSPAPRSPASTASRPARSWRSAHTIVGQHRHLDPDPVQVDQRKVVPFGTHPAATPPPAWPAPSTATAAAGPPPSSTPTPTPSSGADTDPNVDADDEIVFMASDAGGMRPAATAPGDPAGVVAGSGVAVAVDDPRGTHEQRLRLPLPASGALDPSAGKDYVDYDFTLTSGDYKTTYKRADGPNPETSKWSRTANYEIQFTDRWNEVSWKVHRRRRLRGRHPRRPQEPVRHLHLRAQQRHLRRRRGCVRRQHRRSGPRHPLLRRRQQRAAHPADPPHVPRPRGRDHRPPGPRHPGDHGLPRLQRGGHRA